MFPHARLIRGAVNASSSTFSIWQDKIQVFTKVNPLKIELIVWRLCLYIDTNSPAGRRWIDPRLTASTWPILALISVAGGWVWNRPSFPVETFSLFILQMSELNSSSGMEGEKKPNSSIEKSTWCFNISMLRPVLHNWIAIHLEGEPWFVLHLIVNSTLERFLWKFLFKGGRVASRHTPQALTQIFIWPRYLVTSYLSHIQIILIRIVYKILFYPS